MKKSIKKSLVNDILISLFVIISVILPGGFYNLKEILFLIICLFNARLIINSLFRKENKLILFFGFIFPTILILYSTMLTGDILTSFFRSFVPYIFLLIFIIRHYNIDFEKILIKSINLILLLTLSIVVMDILTIINVNDNGIIRRIMYGYDIGLMGKSESYPFFYKVFIKTSPLLVILLFRKFNERKSIAVILTLIALILSGTRANVVFPIFFLLIYYVLFTGNRSRIVKYTFVFTIASLLILFQANILDTLNEALFIKGEQSNIIREGHIEGLKDLVNNNPLIIIFGSGMGSSFYSYGSNSLTSSIEWSYLDLWRQMGFLLFALFITFLFIPLFIKNKSEKYKKFAYISYLIVAGTNPLLFSSTGYLVYLYMYYDLEKNKVTSTS